MTNETERSDSVCNEADGCPTETAVLKRQWRRLTEENKRLCGLLRECADLSENWPNIAHTQDLAERIEAALTPNV